MGKLGRYEITLLDLGNSFSFTIAHAIAALGETNLLNQLEEVSYRS
jgi:hypothetical protein